MSRSFANFQYILDDRGQTAIDFLAGMTVFLVTIGFVLNFIPGVFQPFDGDTGPDMVAADRSGALLAESALVDDVGAPGVLNETCTAEFFDGDGDTADCSFESDSDDLNDALGIDDATEVNVTIENGTGIRTVEGDSGPVAAEVGRAPPPTADVVTATRVVLLEGEQGKLNVRVW